MSLMYLLHENDDDQVSKNTLTTEHFWYSESSGTSETATAELVPKSCKPGPYPENIQKSNALNCHVPSIVRFDAFLLTIFHG